VNPISSSEEFNLAEAGNKADDASMQHEQPQLPGSEVNALFNPNPSMCTKETGGSCRTDWALNIAYFFVVMDILGENK